MSREKTEKNLKNVENILDIVELDIYNKNIEKIAIDIRKG